MCLAEHQHESSGTWRAACCRPASAPLQTAAATTPGRNRRPPSSARGSRGRSLSHPAGREAPLEINRVTKAFTSPPLRAGTYREAVVLQQVSQDLHQGRERGPLFGLALPAGQHDAVSASRGQHSATDVLLQSIFDNISTSTQLFWPYLSDWTMKMFSLFRQVREQTPTFQGRRSPAPSS